MLQNNTGGKRVKNTQSTTVKGTFMYRCHLSAKHPIFSDRREFTEIITATCEEHALGIFIANLRNKIPQFYAHFGSMTVAQLIISNR